MPFSNQLNKHKVILSLSADQVESNLVQTSSFDSLGIKSIVGVGAIIKEDQVQFEAKSLIKWGLPWFNSAALYLGIKQSQDGASFLLGFKVAGIKLMFPIIMMDKTQNKKET